MMTVAESRMTGTEALCSTTTTNRSFEERAPYDVLWTIATLSDRETIHSLYLTCKYTYHVTSPLLWRRVTLDSDKIMDIEERLDAMIRNGRAVYVHSCRIVFKQTWLDREVRTRILDKRLRVLGMMKNLKKLTINAVSNFDSSVSSTLQGLHDVSFHLESLSTNIIPDRALFDFLGTQPSILHLDYSGKKRLIVPGTILPNLTSVQVNPEVLVGFAGGQRPISALHLRGFVSGSIPLHHICRDFMISQFNCPIRHLSVAVDTLTELFGSSLAPLIPIFANHLCALELTFTGILYGSEAGFWALMGRFSNVVHLTLILTGRQWHDNFDTERMLPHLPGRMGWFNGLDDQPSALQTVVVVRRGGWDEYSRGPDPRTEGWGHVGHDGPSVPYPQHKLNRMTA
ncbi:uncharacterized protein EI90DRAFT_682688 [Cantharellus anzutake]|uniref:uncharacterized protein n=1 Tax=Cantharellus anzutake TaxID=1750568 RepID=UPI0019036C20|nr:uncharacterized protein EI90DRAFT_682688 [Cantharellus anzutake]KAF8332662.1 hypothetical protein EI90DRAFT_682688 [Cantharellus anzutake]